MTPITTSASQLAKRYDVIIAGGGQAGLTLASRLTEESSIQVLVVEAGAANLDDQLVLTPPMVKQLYMNDQYDWHFPTEPQDKYADRRVMHFRGKGLGGTSAINLFALVFPSKQSLDAWESLGNPGWGFEAMRPYYQKFHTLHKPSDATAAAVGLHYLEPALHGKSGPIQATFGNEVGEYDKAWQKTFSALGYPGAHEPLRGICNGAFVTPHSVNPETLQRSYAGSAYFTKEVRARPNLHVITEALVQKVILEGDKVIGVRSQDVEGQVVDIHARETIVCGGVFQSPQILELSGIGNASLLKGKGITALVDLPGVGEGLQDHANVGISFESKIPTMDSFRDPQTIVKALEQYQTTKSGPLSKTLYSGASMPCVNLMMGTGQAGFAALLDKTRLVEPTYPAVHQQHDLLRAIVTDPKNSSLDYLGAAVQMSAGQSGGSDNLSEEARSKDYFTIFASLSHPFSRGTVHITSSDPKAAPAIDPKYFSHPVDAELMTQHLQWMNKIVTTEPLASLLVPGGRRIPENIDLTDPKQARDAIKTGFTTYHPCGTCAMMPKELGGVVDSKLRVHGVKGLRVVDASIFPLIPRGNLQTSVYAVAEKAADLIKEDIRRAKA